MPKSVSGINVVTDYSTLAAMYFLLVFLALFAYSEASHWDRINLTVAVVEYHPIFRSGLTKEGRILANAEEHVRKIKAIKPLDLIVFPEYGLTIDPETAIELENFDNPCNNEGTYPTFIRDISCAARNASTYVVFNLVRKVKCGRNTLSKNCRRYGHFFYNTNVVLNRSGQIIYLYHKYNLFGEKNIDRPLTPQTSGLVTDFGLTLGILSGFDILCKNPAQDLLAYKEINAIVSPSKWYSELPFLTSLQTQRMWSYAHDIPLIAAGVNDPSTGNGGTGIYLGREREVQLSISSWGSTQTFSYGRTIAGLRKIDPDTDSRAKNMDEFNLSVDPSVIDYNSIVLDTSRQNFTGQVCYNSSEENQICCDFTTKITTTPSDIKKNSYTYHLVAYSGVRSFDGFYNGGVEVCGIIACLNASLSSCGQRFPNYDDIEWPITFDQITIKAAFENDENKAQYPNSLLSSIQPIIENQMVWDAKEVKIDGKNCIERTLSLNNPQDRVLTFAIYGRNFARDAIVPDNDDNVDDNNNNIDGDDDDDEDDDNNSVKTIGISWFMLISGIVISIFTTK